MAPLLLLLVFEPLKQMWSIWRHVDCLEVDKGKMIRKAEPAYGEVEK